MIIYLSCHVVAMRFPDHAEWVDADYRVRVGLSVNTITAPIGSIRIATRDSDFLIFCYLILQLRERKDLVFVAIPITSCIASCSFVNRRDS